jgi:antitoxin component of MazEF toxin-antitoxin module
MRAVSTLVSIPGLSHEYGPVRSVLSAGIAIVIVVFENGICKELNLQPGDSLELDCIGDQITLRPLRESGPLSSYDRKNTRIEKEFRRETRWPERHLSKMAMHAAIRPV